MIKRIVIENFMSHRRTVIEPAEGLTLLTGPNNCGKSAVVSALQILCSNESGAHKWCVRHGQKSAKIVVETDDHHRLEWVAESGKVHYMIDGVRTDRLNRGLPDQLMPKLKLPEVVGDDGKTFDIHFSPQKDPIFLLGGGSRAATFFAASSDAGYLVKMQQLLRQRRMEHNGLQRDLKGRIGERDALLQKLDGLPAVEDLLVTAQREFEDIEAGNQQADGLKQRISGIDRYEREQREGAAWCDALRELETPPILEDADSLRRSLERLHERSTEAIRATETVAALESLESLPEIEAVEPLRQAVSDLHDKARYVTILAAKTACVQELPPPPELASSVELSQDVTRLESGREQIVQRNAELGQVEVELEKALTALREHIEANPTCPVCGAAIDPESVLHGGHTHA